MFSQDFSCPDLLIVTLISHSVFDYGTITLYREPFQVLRLTSCYKLTRAGPLSLAAT